ncbi:membrane protein [Candidatus Magnetobacterium bavaricum]|uniref:Membrane protein n=1 Tax=Candidatus Magnetobacterium bavaricum TaxID=29290 RepID=A0A0F3H0N2_9BACT|nr:membrane protein [Candidatus Magnetobacterium bavaricum]
MPGDRCRVFVQEAVGSQERVLFSELDHQLKKSEYLCIFLCQFPVKPSDFVVLTIGVVVTVLCACYFVSGQEHRDPVGDKHQRGKVLYLLSAQTVYFGGPGGTFPATVPTEVFIRAVSVVLAVVFIVFAIVSYKVVKGKAVVAGNEVYAVPGFTIALFVHLRRAHQACDNGLDHAGFSPNESPYVVAELAIPLGPPSPVGKRPHLIQPGGIPGLCDQLGVGQDRVGGYTLQQRRVS